jgi:DNA modification methylase
MRDATLIHGDCTREMLDLESASVDAIITDPPYPEIDRDYGRMTEKRWHAMMRIVVEQSRRILKPHGSAVFILQPNMKRLGTMRPWLWEFMAWTCREWNQIQDHWYWNYATLPQACTIKGQLCRPSIKACVWLGPPHAYRNQNNVLWTESEANRAHRLTARAGRVGGPSGHSYDMIKITGKAVKRGGVTPFNLLPVAATDSQASAGALGHGAGTPNEVCDWWLRYITRPGDTILDPFMGSGTMGRVALARGRSFIGIEKMEKYYKICQKTIEPMTRKPAIGQTGNGHPSP